MDFQFAQYERHSANVTCGKTIVNSDNCQLTVITFHIKRTTVAEGKCVLLGCGSSPASVRSKASTTTSLQSSIPFLFAAVKRCNLPCRCATNHSTTAAATPRKINMKGSPISVSGPEYLHNSGPGDKIRAMPRAILILYPSAIYHFINRGGSP